MQQQYYTGNFAVCKNNSSRSFYCLGEDGYLYSRGDNRCGQLGTGDAESRDALAKVDFPKQTELRKVDMCASNLSFYLVDENRQLYACGHGYGNKLSLQFSARCSKICAGLTSLYVLDEEGNLYARGNNIFGQLGLGDNCDRGVFAKIDFGGLGPGVRIVAGWQSLYLLTEQGDIYSCGYNNCGQLALGDTKERNSLTKIDFPKQNTEKAQLFSDSYSLYLIDDQGDLHACGNNQNGQLGLGDTTNRKAFTKLGRVGTKSKIAVGGYSLYILDEKNDLYACGYGQGGRLGTGDDLNRTTLTKVNLGNIEKNKTDICANEASLFVYDGKAVFSCGR